MQDQIYQPPRNSAEKAPSPPIQADLYLAGKIKHEHSGLPLIESEIYIHGINLSEMTLRPDSLGEFEISLELGDLYFVSVRAAGYVSKLISIDTRDIPDEDRKGGYSMYPNVSLFEEQDGIDLSFLETEPIGKCAYNPEIGVLEWDVEYTNVMKARIKRVRDY